MKKLSALALLGALVGCNTFEGIGRDLAAGGEAIEDAAVTAQQPVPVVQPQPVYQQVPQRQPIYQPAPQQQPIFQQQPVVQPYNPNTPQIPNSNYTF